MSFKTSKYASSFSPQDLPGLVVWLDAADSRTLTMVGSNVSRWNDKVTNGTQYAESNIFTGPTLGTVNGVQALRYTTGLGTGMMYFGSSYTPKTTGFSYFFAFSPTSSTTWGARIFHAYTATDRLFIILSNSVAVLAGAGEWAWSQTTPVHDNLTIVTAFEDTSAMSVILNGSLATSAPTPAATAASTITQASVGTGFAGADRLDGFMCEILFYNRTMPIADRQLVEGYLRRKWSRTFSSNHPYAIVPPVTRQFNPLDVSGCSLWLDAGDSSTITLSGSNVSNWKDKSGSNYSAMSGGLYALPPYTSNSARPYVQFGINQTLVVGNWSYTPGWTVFCAQCNVSIGGGRWYISPFDNLSLVMMGFSNLKILFPLAAQTEATGNHIECTMASNTNGTAPYYYFRDGVQIATSNSAQTIGAATVRLGIGGNGNGADPLINSGSVFNMYELLIYNRSLPDSDRQRVELYLAEKWSLRSDLSTANPLRLFRALSPVFNPTLISNCSLWLDVADQSSLTLSGSNITGIVDKSGLGISVSVSTTKPTLNSSFTNGFPAAAFTGSQWFRGNFPSTYGGSNIAMFAVASVNSATSGNGRLLSLATTGAFDVLSTNAAILRPGSAQGVAAMRGAIFSTASVSGYNTPFIMANVFDGASATIHINGALGASNASSGSFSINNFGVAYLADYGGTDDTAYWIGNISEVIFYLGAITPQNRQRIEAYLAKKWNIALPTTHPYYSTPV